MTGSAIGFKLYPPIRRKCLVARVCIGGSYAPCRVFSCEKLQQPNCNLVLRMNPVLPAIHAYTRIKLHLSMERGAFFVP